MFRKQGLHARYVLFGIDWESFFLYIRLKCLDISPQSNDSKRQVHIFKVIECFWIVGIFPFSKVDIFEDMLMREHVCQPYYSS